jgi:hypothetical protein
MASAWCSVTNWRGICLVVESASTAWDVANLATVPTPHPPGLAISGLFSSGYAIEIDVNIRKQGTYFQSLENKRVIRFPESWRISTHFLAFSSSVSF